MAVGYGNTSEKILKLKSKQSLPIYNCKCQCDNHVQKNMLFKTKGTKK